MDIASESAKAKIEGRIAGHAGQRAMMEGNAKCETALYAKKQGMSLRTSPELGNAKRTKTPVDGRRKKKRQTTHRRGYKTGAKMSDKKVGHTEGRRGKGQEDYIRILQTNQNRSRGAGDLMYKTAEEQKADVVVIAEPNLSMTEAKKWITNNRREVAIWVRGKHGTREKGEGRGFAFVRYNGHYIYACYISPNITEREVERVLEELAQSVRARTGEIIICGDFNAKSPTWGAEREDKRGRILEEWMASLGLETANRGREPTCTRGIQGSHIDLTMGKSGCMGRFKRWEVLKKENLSDHRDIMINYRRRNTRGMEEKKVERLIINEEKINECVVEIGKRILGGDGRTPEESGKMIEETTKRTLEKKKGRSNTRIYWWNERVEKARNECGQKRRGYSRLMESWKTRGGIESHKKLQEYKDAKKFLKREITKAKKEAWEKVCEEVEQDVWGEGYGIVTDKVRKRNKVMEEEETIAHMAKLFPRLVERRESREITAVEKEDYITEGEVEQAANEMKTGKAPGPDGVPQEVISALAKRHPRYISEVMNVVIKRGAIPSEWKEARVVLLLKEKKEGKEAAYRPICLINSLAKLFEKLINKRLLEEIEERGGLSEQQYGFRKGRSTVTALERVKERVEKARRGAWQHRRTCVMVALDVANAFNTVPWDGLMRTLSNWGFSGYLLNLLDDYLSGRKLRAGRGHHMQMSGGVPQGSILGPTLWNLYYDEVLRLEAPQGILIMAYADDLAIIGTDKTASSVKDKIEETAVRVEKWMENKGLKLEARKTEVVILAGKRKLKDLRLKIGETSVGSSKQIKYLGVIMERNPSMKGHIEYASAKAGKAAQALARLMPNKGGATQKTRRVLGSVVQSILLYAAPVWAPALKYASHRGKLEAAQRKIALRVVGAYRTVATEALLMVAGIPPIKLAVEERVRVMEEGRETRSAQREKMMTDWQREWNKPSDKGRWTREIIRDVPGWHGRRHGSVNYYVAQLLTGHGAFRAYLYRFKRASDPWCVYCGQNDTAEHTFFECARWNNCRGKAEQRLGGKIDKNNVVEKMIQDRETWDVLEGMIVEIIKTKEQEERAKQKEEGRGEREEEEMEVEEG